MHGRLSFNVPDSRWKVSPQIVYLSDNHRSDKEIVEWCKDYMNSFPQNGGTERPYIQ